MRTEKTKLLLIGCLAVAITTITACSKNNPLNPLGNCGNGGWTVKVSKELNDFSTAASSYSTDPTPANCEAYKNAAKNYLDALEGVRGCVIGANQVEFNKAIAEAKEDVDQDDCDG